MPDTFTHSWKYMGDASANPMGVEWFGMAMGLVMPRLDNDFEVRWFAEDRATRRATSPTIHVHIAAPTLRVNGVDQLSTLTVLPDATLTVDVTDECAILQDFVALMRHDASDTDEVLAYAYLSGTEHPPLYLSGTHTPPAAGLASASFTLALPPATSGTFDVRMFVDEQRARLATGATIEVSTPPQVGPAVTITNPASGAAFGAGETVTLTATASDTGPGITQVAFYADGNLINTITSPPWTTGWGTSVDGAHALTAVATSGTPTTG